MAELILSSVGGAIGSRLAPVAFRALGAALGRTAGRLIGGAIDNAFEGPVERQGPRLTDLHLQGSTEGASLPAVYGMMRLAGQVIWAARFKERASTTTTSSGGKGGGRSVETTNYTYSLSFAVGICEGPAARIGRVWANGEALDLSTISWRFHPGTEDQAPDPLIEAIEGADHAPAYRGLAYIVFEDLPLDPYGNVMPQLSFEIIRPPPRADGAKRLEDRARAVCLIPGAGEFVYASEVVRRVSGPGEEVPENMHAQQERANLAVSLDQLQIDLPNVEAALLVVSWFGTDLRCGVCEIRPGVEISSKATRPITWLAGGVNRAGAHLISLTDGAPSFGGTPADAAVIQAIAELKSRGLKVGLYPFILMDIPPGNGLPDPQGASEQPAFPWRGRITCHPAAGESGSPDKSAAAATQVSDFFGVAAASDFSIVGGNVFYSGPAEWSFRRFILHYAKLAVAAGGVDFFILGSELRDLTSVRSGASAYPAVSALTTLAADVRGVLGGGVKLTYAADWSEYRGHQPQDGSGDVYFHLDPLWAHSAIDAVGVDWYAPLTDWRDGSAHLDAALAPTIYDPTYLEGRIEAGEDYDFHYVSDLARATQTRSAIADGAAGKPWVFRAKDVRNWWSNPHYDRPGGVEAAGPTAWVPQSKPIWFTEFGVPAIDKGANAPNLFIDPKSTESAAPPFSSGLPDDLIQRRALEAYLKHWDATDGANPISSVYGGPMIDPDRMFLWAWDARPYPEFPARTDVWADSGSWRLGHWLNGRAGAATLADTVADLCHRAGMDDADVSTLSGLVPGYIVDSPASARDGISPLMLAYGFDGAELEGRIVFAHRDPTAPLELTFDDVVQSEDGRASVTRADAAALPAEARVRYIDFERDYRMASISARQHDAAAEGAQTLEAPLALDADQAEALAQRLLAQGRAGAETLSLSLPPSMLRVTPGDRFTLDAPGAEGVFRAESVAENGERQVKAFRDVAIHARVLAIPSPAASTPPPPASAPDLVLLDLPPLPGFEDDSRPLAAVFASPWLGPIDILAGPATDRLTRRGVAVAPAISGEILWDLYPGPAGRWDEGNYFQARFYGDGASSLSAEAVLDGANSFAVQQADGNWEILQARTVTLVASHTYEISGLLRGQQGTAPFMGGPTLAGARIVKLDERLVRVSLQSSEIGAPLVWAAVLAGRSGSDPAASQLAATLSDVWARPFPPAHVSGVRLGDGSVRIDWVRRARLNGDAWLTGEPPLSEESEAYVLEIMSGASVVRTISTASPQAIYGAADQVADFGAPPSSVNVRVAQISAVFGPGGRAESTLWL